MSKGRATWTRANQDTLGSRQKCESVARAALQRSSNVIVDRCNFDVDQRSPWLQIAEQAGVLCTALWLDLGKDIAAQRALHRVGHEGKVSGDFGRTLSYKFSGFIDGAVLQLQFSVAGEVA